MSKRQNLDWIEVMSDPQIDGVRAQTANLTRATERPRHVHHAYIFSLAIEGVTEYDCGHCGSTHDVQPKDLLLTEAHEVYASRTRGESPWRNFSLSVSVEKLQSVLDEAGDGKSMRLPHFKRGSVTDARLRRLFLKLHNSLGSNCTVLEQETLLLDWLVSLQERYAFEADQFFSRRMYSESAAIRRVREFICDNACENIRLQTLGEIAQLSPFHLNRAFKKEIGLPPHEYQNQLRIEQALNLIAQKKSFAEIALETGFSDQSHFNRFFKRYTGVTPKRFFTV